MTLTELGTKHGTDKATFHDYCRIYEQYLEPLRDQPIALLEIGIAGGCSLRMWADYFPHPDRQIWGVDHNAEAASQHSHGNLGIFTLRADSTFPEDWLLIENVYVTPHEDPHDQVLAERRFDIVVDDGSHAVWATFQALAHGWKLLKPGGLWFIEDIHAGWDAAFRRDNEAHGLPPDWTVQDVVNDIAKERLHESGDSQCGRQTFGDIEFVHYYKSLIVLKKAKR